MILVCSCIAVLFKSGLICKTWTQMFVGMMMGKVSFVTRIGDRFMHRRILCKKKI